MREVMHRIEGRVAQYAQSPFFEFLRDPTVEPRRKLAFAPRVSHYVLTFADLCALILPEDPPRDGYQALVNANAAEDAGHWEWFLSDLGTLGQDPELRYSDAVRTLWSDATVRTRRLSYYLCHYGIAADPIGKLALVHCFEEAFKVTIAEIRPVASEFAALTGRPLKFLGGVHVEAEDAHTLEQPGMSQQVESIELTPEVRAAHFRMVDTCFELFTAFAAEMLDLARSAPLPVEANGTAFHDDPDTERVPVVSRLPLR